MTVESSLNVSGQQIKLKEEYQSSNSQQFRLVYNSSGRYYTASPTCSYNGYGIVLDVCGGIGNGNGVWTYTNNGASEERLVFYAFMRFRNIIQIRIRTARTKYRSGIIRDMLWIIRVKMLC